MESLLQAQQAVWFGSIQHDSMGCAARVHRHKKAITLQQSLRGLHPALNRVHLHYYLVHSLPAPHTQQHVQLITLHIHLHSTPDVGCLRPWLPE